MPRLGLTFAEFIAIISKNGFVLLRQGVGSHQRWVGIVGGVPHPVDIAPHGMNSDIPIGTLQAMIRQTGLPKKIFRK